MKKREMKEIIVQEITIPEENNILFSNPLICLVITSEEDSYQIFCKLNEKLELNNKVYNTYYPLKRFKISCENKLRIEIKTNRVRPKNSEVDILKCDNKKIRKYSKWNYKYSYRFSKSKRYCQKQIPWLYKSKYAFL